MGWEGVAQFGVVALIVTVCICIIGTVANFFDWR